MKPAIDMTTFRYSTATRTQVHTMSGAPGPWSKWRTPKHASAARSADAVTEAHRRPVAAQPKENNNASET